MILEVFLVGLIVFIFWPVAYVSVVHDIYPCVIADGIRSSPGHRIGTESAG